MFDQAPVYHGAPVAPVFVRYALQARLAQPLRTPDRRRRPGGSRVAAAAVRAACEAVEPRLFAAPLSNPGTLWNTFMNDGATAVPGIVGGAMPWSASSFVNDLVGAFGSGWVGDNNGTYTAVSANSTSHSGTFVGQDASSADLDWDYSTGGGSAHSTTSGHAHADATAYGTDVLNNRFGSASTGTWMNGGAGTANAEWTADAPTGHVLASADVDHQGDGTTSANGEVRNVFVNRFVLVNVGGQGGAVGANAAAEARDDGVIVQVPDWTAIADAHVGASTLANTLPANTFAGNASVSFGGGPAGSVSNSLSHATTGRLNPFGYADGTVRSAAPDATIDDSAHIEQEVHINDLDYASSSANVDHDGAIGWVNDLPVTMNSSIASNTTSQDPLDPSIQQYADTTVDGFADGSTGEFVNWDVDASAQRGGVTSIDIDGQASYDDGGTRRKMTTDGDVDLQTPYLAGTSTSANLDLGADGGTKGTSVHAGVGAASTNGVTGGNLLAYALGTNNLLASAWPVADETRGQAQVTMNGNSNPGSGEAETAVDISHTAGTMSVDLGLNSVDNATSYASGSGTFNPYPYVAALNFSGSTQTPAAGGTATNGAADATGHFTSDQAGGVTAASEGSSQADSGLSYSHIDGAGSARNLPVTRNGSGDVVVSFGGLVLAADAPFDADGATATASVTVNVTLDQNGDGYGDYGLLSADAATYVNSSGTFTFSSGGAWHPFYGTFFNVNPVAQTATLTTTSFAVPTVGAVSGERLIVEVSTSMTIQGGNSAGSASLELTV